MKSAITISIDKGLLRACRSTAYAARRTLSAQIEQWIDEKLALAAARPSPCAAFAGFLVLIPARRVARPAHVAQTRRSGQSRGSHCSLTPAEGGGGVIGGTPSRIKSLRALRRRMDAELARAIEPEEAEQRGLTPVTEVLGVRLWDNVIFAIRTMRETPGDRTAVLVRLREGRSVQVWARPTGTVRD